MLSAMTPLHAFAGLVATAVLAAAGFAGFGHAPASQGDAGAFGGPVAHRQVHALYVERGTPSQGMREVRCDGPHTTARCFEAPSAR